METIRDIGKVKGTVFDLPHAMSLSPSDCNVLVVSSRTLFFVQLFGTGEMDFLSRYASSLLDGNKYVLAEDSADLDDINDLVNNYELEVQPVTCDLVAAIEALTEATVTAGSGCCTPYGPDYPPPAPDLEDPDLGPPPDDWSTWESYNTYKCKAVNMIIDNWIDSLKGFATLSGILAAIGALALAAFVNTALLSGLLVGLMMLGFSAGAAAAVIIGAFIWIIAGGIQLLVYFLEVGNVMENTKEDLVCLLYEAQSPVAAKNAIQLFTSDIAENIVYDPADDSTLFLLQLDIIVDALFNDALVNVLFELNLDADVYVGDTSCDGCLQLPPLNWKIANSGYVGATSAEGTLGTGVVENDGTQFVVTSVQNLSALPSVEYIIAMVVRKAEAGGGLCLTHDGRFTINQDPGGHHGGDGLRCVGEGSCGTAWTWVEMGGEGDYDGWCAMWRVWTTQKQMTFSIPISPANC